MNISSAIVYAQASGLEHVRKRLLAIAGVEVHAAGSDGRLVVSIESPGDQDTADIFEAIQRLDGVLAASLVYSHFESDPDQKV
ncbi:MAG: chaperone NapD [Rhodocyclales bacterium]|nr:chaperone NapD [Rhodocyclales bacterium]